MTSLLRRIFAITVLLLSVFSASHAGYDPTIGRWLSRDPIAEEGGLNLYRYVDNDPARRIDRLGLQAALVPGYPVNPFTAAPIEGHPDYDGPKHRPAVAPWNAGNYANQFRGMDGADSIHHAVATCEVGRWVGDLVGPFKYPLGFAAAQYAALMGDIGEAINPSSDWESDVMANHQGAYDFLGDVDYSMRLEQ